MFFKADQQSFYKIKTSNFENSKKRKTIINALLVFNVRNQGQSEQKVMSL